jgi:2-polyprenyl-6-methoxyphenol hydroxylase-like FAD-dependent oxidoreductase
MALLDAMALSLALGALPLDEALPRYAGMRRWHMRAYQAISAAFTPMYQSDSRLLPLLRDHLLAPVSQWPGVRQGLTRLVTGNLIPPLASTRWPG